MPKLPPCFKDLTSLSIRAAIEGNNPGRIFVDNVEQPRTALALTVEGTLLAGDYGSPDTNEALRRFLKESIFTGRVFLDEDECIYLAVHPDTWEAKLPELIPTHEAEKIRRYHYLCHAVKFNWRDYIPAGYSVHRLDQTMLSDSDIVIHEEIQDWTAIEANWGTVENFLAKGIGFRVVRGNEMVSCCAADCTADAQIDVGIVTHPEHRRRGLAAVATAATVEYCLNSGFKAVGWHCDEENVGSRKTAEKVGFEKTCEYIHYYYIFDVINHLAELGWYNFKHGEYEKTTQYYERVFALREDHPSHYYNCAAEAWGALGNREMALKYLNLAVDKGWAMLDYTRQAQVFRFLHDTPEWEDILSRMEKE